MLFLVELTEMLEYIGSILDRAAAESSGSPADDELKKIQLICVARIALDIIEAQSVHSLRTSIPALSYSEIGEAQGISKQASRIRHTKLEQVLNVHQLDGKRHAISKAVVPAKHRRAARPSRQARRTNNP